MLNETQLKKKLEAIAQNDFRLSEDDLSAILPEMMHHIGSTDSQLRDELIYTAFGTWILEHNSLSPTQLRGLLQKVLSDQQMFYNIGEQNGDSIFRRSFSVLLLPLILIAHRSTPFLMSAEISQVKVELLRYLNQEQDLRGFVEDKGWAHGMAHAADVLDDLAQCVELNEADLIEILVAIRAMIAMQDVGYIHGEDERAITAVIAIINRRLISEADFTQWIHSFVAPVLAVQSMPQNLVIRTNVKNFLQSLHFRLKWEKMTDDYEVSINQALRKISFYSKSEGD